jgi:FkbM family methyltransferase
MQMPPDATRVPRAKEWIMSVDKLRHAIRRGVRRALQVDVVRVDNTTPLGRHLREVLARYRIDTVVDVGANEGQFGAMMRALGFKGDIHSFEPVNLTYDLLTKATAGDPHWTAHNMALGRAPGRLVMNVSEGSVFSSVLRPNDYGAAKFSDIKVQRQEEVEVSTLDHFIERHLSDKKRRIFLKMDTQGYDLEVFAGARASLDTICCILSELSLIPIYDGMTDYLQALAVYQHKGFSVSGLFPVNRSDDLSLIEVDCVMVRGAAHSA